MQPFKQIDCFNIQIKFWGYLGLWFGENSSRYYSFYSKFLIAFITLHNLVGLFNTYFVPMKLDVFIGEMLFYFTDIASTCKIMTVYILGKDMKKLFTILESDIFQPNTIYGIDILDKAKSFNRRYWKIVASFSLISHFTHILSGIKNHVFYSEPLVLPMSGYYFLSEEFKDTYIYFIYAYQAVSVHYLVWVNINIDSFILGLIILMIAQIDILDMKLRTITDGIVEIDAGDTNEEVSNSAENDDEYITKLNECIVHFMELETFCYATQEIFSTALFVQFGISSMIICVCLFRFTLPAPSEYYLFLATYIFIMIMQILAPSWFGTRVVDKAILFLSLKSGLLPLAVYNCDWTPRSRRFKSSLRIFAERTSRPLAITAGKMFPISLTTFTSIINSAYSFFTLLQHMQSIDT